MSNVGFSSRSVMASSTRIVKRQHPLTTAIKTVWVIIAVCFVVGGAFKTFGENYQIFYDSQDVRCIPEYSVYLMEKIDGDIHPVTRGKVYMFRSKNMTPYFADNMPMGKYALAVGGDHVVINEQGIYVNGELKITGFALVEKLGIKQEDLYTEYTLADHQVFFAGTGERSFDSRYWGLASTSQIFGEATPLW